MSTTTADVQLHPWNTEFEWVDQTAPPSTLTVDQVRQFDEQGYVVVPDLIDAATLAEVIEATDGFEQKTDDFLSSMDEGRFSIAEKGAITFTTHLVSQSRVLRDLSMHPSIVGICRDLCGPDVSLYWDQAVYKKPEKPRRFPWHQDNGYAFVDPQQYLTVWLALTDTTLENGCPHIAPGFHRLGTLKHHYVDPLGFECLSEPANEVVAEVPAGGAAVFSSLTPHLTGPNTADSVRKAYILQYAPTGAEVLRGEPKDGPPTRESANEPSRQYPVLINGERVASK